MVSKTWPDQAQLDFINEALDGLKSGVGVGHAEQPHAGEANISKNLEILGAADLIKDDEVRTNEEDDSAVFSRSPSSGAYCVMGQQVGKSLGASIVLTNAPTSVSRYSAMAWARVVYPNPGAHR